MDNYYLNDRQGEPDENRKPFEKLENFGGRACVYDHSICSDCTGGGKQSSVCNRGIPDTSD